MAARISELQEPALKRAEWDAEQIIRRAGEIAMQDRNDRVPALALLSKRLPEFRDSSIAVTVNNLVVGEGRL